MAQDTDPKDPTSHSVPFFVETGLPEWMVPPKTHVGPPYTEHQLERIFVGLAEGKPYAALRREDPALPTLHELMKVLRRDPALLNRYYEAQEDGSEALVDIGTDLISGVEPDGSPCMDEVPRLQARLHWIKWVAGARYNKRYGEKKQLEVNNKVDLTDALKAAEQRAQQMRLSRGTVIEGELDED